MPMFLFSEAHEKSNNLHRYVGLSRKLDYPLIFVKGNCVGSIPELEKLVDKGIIAESFKSHDYDFVVIGGGSGGLAAAKVQ